MSKRLLEAIKSLDAAAVKAALAEDADAVRGHAFVVSIAFQSWVRLHRSGSHSPTPARIATMLRAHRSLLKIFKALLEAGAQPRGALPQSFNEALDVNEACSLPLEAGISHIEPPLAVPLLELLQAHGSRLDGLCDGACANAQSSGMRCGALSAALALGFSSTDISPEVRAMIDASGTTSVVVSHELVGLLVRSGAGSIELRTMAGRLTAAHAALLFAIMNRAEDVATVLLDVGVSPDYEIFLPMDPPFRPLHATALRSAVEEAANEEVNTGDGPDIVIASREEMIKRRRLRALFPPKDGPAQRILRAMLAKKCPRSLAFRCVSSRTGSVLGILTYPAQHGAVGVVRALLAAGASVDDLSDLSDPHPAVSPEGVETALEVAAGWDQTDVVRELLKAGARADRSPRALANAAKNGSLETLAVLLAAKGGASVLERVCHQPACFFGMTPLMVAALHQQTAVVAVLIAAGARAAPSESVARIAEELGCDPDDPRLGRTPMSLAVVGGADAEVIEELVRAGAARPDLRSDARDGVLFLGRDGSRVAHADAASASLRHSCDACGMQPSMGSPPLLLCGRCKVRRYCGVECQRAAWKSSHAAECKDLVKSGAR